MSAALLTTLLAAALVAWAAVRVAGVADAEAERWADNTTGGD